MAKLKAKEGRLYRLMAPNEHHAPRADELHPLPQIKAAITKRIKETLIFGPNYYRNSFGPEFRVEECRIIVEQSHSVMNVVSDENLIEILKNNSKRSK